MVFATLSVRKEGAVARQLRLDEMPALARAFGYQLVHVEDPGSAQAAATL